MKTKEEIQEQIDIAISNPGKFKGLSYMDGVRIALEWVLGDVEDTPTED